MTVHRLTRKDLLAIHAMQIARYGGAPGIENKRLLESVLARVPDAAAKGEEKIAQLAALAAAYAYGIAKNHPFLDGNRRTALVAALTLIERNGFHVIASQQDAYFAVYNLALEKPSEREFASWLENNIRAVSN
jgi:death on curing protein